MYSDEEDGDEKMEEDEVTTVTNIVHTTHLLLFSHLFCSFLRLSSNSVDLGIYLWTVKFLFHLFYFRSLSLSIAEIQ